jgi:cell surface protein SprA
MFKSGINQVAADYESLKASDPGNVQSTADQKVSQAFVQGFETLPVLDKIFGQYMPRMNYSFSWSGLENLPLFKSFASQVSLNNAYQSTYSQSWHNTNGTGQVTDAQTISYGFQPLLGMNIAFKSIGDASISGSILYNTSTQYSLSPSARTIAEAYTGQLSITADYAKRGFSLPLFGLNLQNDIDISASYSVSQTSSTSYQLDNISSGPLPISGTSQISIELRFKYDVSQRVTASIYYQNTRIVPTVPASPIPGTTTNEAGVDVHVSIAG